MASETVPDHSKCQHGARPTAVCHLCYPDWPTRPAPEYAGLVERLGDAELQRLLKDLTPYREKTIGSLRIDMGEVRKICRAVEVCTEAATALTALEAEVERLRGLLPKPAPSTATHYCKHEPDGCTSHNLHCQWPACAVPRALGDRP